MDRRRVLSDSNFGERVAEDESTQLEKYFVETNHWAKVFSGEADVVYGAKGSGKSALYSLLVQRASALFDRGIIAVSAEQPRGTTVFRDLQQDPPTSEAEFIGLWKLYILTLIDSVFREYGVSSPHAERLDSFLSSAGIVQPRASLSSTLRSVLAYVKSYFRHPESVEGRVDLDPATGLPRGFGGKISFSEPDSSQHDVVSVDQLLREADSALHDVGFVLWVLLDRLDVAFAELPTLEENALRALFRVYLDTKDLAHIRLKIFLRTDIWNRITRAGLREASHITRHITITWDASSLLNLVIRRSIKNKAISEAYGIKSADNPGSIDDQRNLFYRIFPRQVDVGPNKSKTFEWILTRVTDGTKEPAPRELIHFLNAARDTQLRQLEIDSVSSEEGETLFSRSSLRSALPEVSRVRLQQTLYAEYPSIKPYVESLRREKTTQTPRSLARIWRIEDASAVACANTLVEIGFFELGGTKDEPVYRVPFLYRDATDMIQGMAE